MSFEKSKTDSFCGGGRHSSATTKIVDDITCKGSKVLIGHCSKCNRKMLIIQYKLKILVASSRTRVKKDLIYQKRCAKNIRKILEVVWKSEQTLVPHLFLVARRQLYHFY